MKQALALMSVLFLLTCTGCGGDSADKVADDTVSIMNEMATVMESVKDEASAKAANAKLRDLGERMKALKARQDKLALTPEQKIEMEKKYKDKLEPVLQKLLGEAMRISFDPKLKPAMDGLEDVMK
jgi:hypothetical protein